jgi:hypothetical protein
MENSVVEKVGKNLKKMMSPKAPRENRGSRNLRANRTRESFEDAYDATEWIIGFIVLVFLLVVLSPGVLLTIPPGRGGLWMSGTTSVTAAFVHAILLIVILSLI